jgi:hypothetical protein
VADDLSRAAELGEAYADPDLGVVDASVNALCERLGLEIVLTLARRDFSMVRARHCSAHQIVPADHRTRAAAASVTAYPDRERR